MAYERNLIISILVCFTISLLKCQKIKDKDCTSSRIECAFNLTKDPRLYFTELLGAKPYNKICRFNGRLYQLGWKVPVSDNPCIVCKCNELWDDRDPLGSLSCTQMDCESQLQPKLKAGCLPIYSENSCCPIDYHCRQQCVFNGTRYAFGSKLYLNFETQNLCNACTCSAPPTFTCVDHYCPPIPDNCKANHIHELQGCCPTYQCFDENQNKTNSV